ncbi:hypothetical protein HMPREF0663_11799 [Hoylesella oralis ATCC 33269]|uniref:Uncharacterized protein n=1 Tax=Hoylesella oralis ATCC 33269 TaxID=873533 RepID=E7RRJ8_9BACT|nr:hypothetical protein [Hoylesella oralis]EFZ36886.1 hypothetical protein HMPREF0663_11799 [Hoylesella oralis ATCC 33269]EPH18770.1 hypothetical protein HMPREF1475_00679 [Hoylesella oralis HGA0225]SHF75350.1 hypothetical protein SAMN05444288_1435 [Hoylesella oralis]
MSGIENRKTTWIWEVVVDEYRKSIYYTDGVLNKMKWYIHRRKIMSGMF